MIRRPPRTTRISPPFPHPTLFRAPKVLGRAVGAELMPDIGVRVDDYESLRRDALKPRRAAVWLLATVCAVVTFITLVGIASLTGYWVAQRTRKIGIRRALGATRGQLWRNFQVENLTPTSIVVATEPGRES